MIPAAYTSYNEVSAAGVPLVAMVTPEPSQQVLAAWGRYGHQSPLVQRHLQTRDPRASRLSDVIDLAAFRERELYHARVPATRRRAPARGHAAGAADRC